MKTNFNFPKNATRIFLLATVTLLVLSARSTTFAGSATWDLNPGSGNWNTNTNWTPNTGFPNGSSDVATFDVSNTTAVGISANTTVAGITFNSGASAFTITVAAPFALTIGTLSTTGTGITNNSGKTHNFLTAVSGTNFGTISFTNSATAGSMTAFTNNRRYRNRQLGSKSFPGDLPWNSKHRLSHTEFRLQSSY